MAKSAQAFRTIREVAEWLDVAAHVLRFWESKFNQIKPVKRAGGRRYYRPADMELVGGIKVLLHDRGLTIRGVQKMIADEGLEAVTSLSPPIDELVSDDTVVELDASDVWDEDMAAEAISAQPAEQTPATAEETLESAADTVAPEPVPDVAPTVSPAEIPPSDAPSVSAPAEQLAPDPAPSEPVQTPEDLPVDAPSEPSEDSPQEEVTPAPWTAPLPAEPEPVAGDAMAPPEEADTSDMGQNAPEPETSADVAPQSVLPPPASAVQIPSVDPAEGALGTLAALSQLPQSQRAPLAPQIAALAQLRDRLSAPVNIG